MSKSSSISSRSRPQPTQGPDSDLSFSLQLDGREVLSRKRARELLAPLSEGHYTSISLGGCALGDGAAGVAGPALVALANKKCTRSVSFADCIATLSQDEALRSLSALSSSIGIWKGLNYVDLSYNALGSRGVAACAPLLAGQRNLEELHLVESGLAAESARLLQGYLCAGPTTTLRVLEIHSNCLESAGVTTLAAVVEKSPSLERLRLSSLRARPGALQAVASALEGKTALRHLDLSDNKLDAGAAGHFGDILPGLTSLESLLMRDLDMGDNALNVLVTALLECRCPLSELALAGNKLSPTSVPPLKTFVIAYIGVLQMLDVSRNCLGSELAVGLVDAFTDARAKGKSTQLINLMIGSNGISALPLVRLSRQLISFPYLQCFDISGNGLSEAIADRLATALGSNVVIFDSAELEADNVEGAETNANEDDEELQRALEDLANAPSVQVNETAEAKAQPAPVSSGPPSPQSRLSVSRIMSMFTPRTDEAASTTAASQPSSQVEDTGPNPGDVGRPASAPARKSFEDDSGAAPNDADRVTMADDMTGMTVTSSSTMATSQNKEEEYPSTPVGNTSTVNANLFQSARKLKESIESLSREISDVAGELQIPASSPDPSRRGSLFSRSSSGAEDPGNMNEYLLVDRLPSERVKQSHLIFVLDILGGLLIGVFVVILVLAIAQSQEESSFSYRLV